MRFISTKFHGVLDYLVGILLIAAPWLFNFDNNTAAQWVPVIVGIAIILMSLLTNYEAGAVKKIPMSTHLTVDVIIGIFLAVSPWLFRFADQVYLPHLIFGLLAMGSGIFTETSPHNQGLRNQDMRHAH